MKQRKLDLLWVPIQGLAILALVLTPFWVARDFRESAPKVLGALLLEKLRTPADPLHSSITSDVVRLPLPLKKPQSNKAQHAKRENAEEPRYVSMSVNSRQVRFETCDQSLVHRRPTSVIVKDLKKSKKGSVWKLAKILRKSEDGSWDSIPLVPGESDEVWSSVFLELVDGINHFQVDFQTDQGEHSAYFVELKMNSSS